MNFAEIWQQYDFTEAELLSITWQPPQDCILNLNYYWELNSTDTAAEVATVDQPLKLALVSCIRLEVQFLPEMLPVRGAHPTMGTVVGWGRVTPSPWIEELDLPPADWLHLEFDVGGDNKIEALCRSLKVEQLKARSRSGPEGFSLLLTS